MPGCTKERFGGHAKKAKKQRGAGYGREKFGACKSKPQKAGSHCTSMHQKSKKMRKPSKKYKKTRKNGRK